MGCASDPEEPSPDPDPATASLPSTAALSCTQDPPVVKDKGKTKKKKLYDVEDMQKAIAAVREQGWQKKKAALFFKVPRSTLHDKLLNKYPDSDKPLCFKKVTKFSFSLQTVK